ncbi:hypothetical protein AMTR_s00050p00224980 [Amborella trichopoda]|uniref:Aminotransferase-like plant mobile domain-containing protein n=1 Tax=Amborella trichopoda TaxID=13333 RepID=W1PXH2_AMBTC|nr:hypothetical protein AMTR_s00050p00224980 [Amborella trichopoda]
MPTSYASDCKELLGIPFQKIRGRHDLEIQFGKLWWEFTGIPHSAERMIGGRAPHISVSVEVMLDHQGIQKELSAILLILVMGDEDTVPPQIVRYIPYETSLHTCLGIFLFVDRSKGRAHLSVVWATRQLDYLERVAWGPAVVGWLHYHLCSVARGACYLGGSAIFLQVRAWEHITIPCPLPGRLAPSLPTIHCWSYRVWDSERLPSRLYYLLFLDTQAVGETPMIVEPIPAAYMSSSQPFRTTAHLICMFLVMATFPGRVYRQLDLPQTSCEITPPWTPIMVSTADEDAYLREIAPWIEEWRSRAARVIRKEEEEGISLSQYEDRYKDILRDIATLTDHSEGMMRKLRAAYLDEGRLPTDEIASLHAERDSAIEELDSIAEDFEHLCQNFDGVVAKRDSVRDELERVQAELERL